MKKIRNWVIYILGVLVLLYAVSSFFGIFNLSSDEGGCGNVVGIELHGELVTYISPDYYDEEGNLISDQTASEEIVYAIEDAERDDNIKAIILEIDSLGGYPVAAEEVANALLYASKPTIALIREYGTSAAYLAATGADFIFASENSDIGSIGVTMSYLDYSKWNEEDGIIYQQISSGKFKDTGDSDKSLSDEEREYLERDVMIMHENFVKVVSENRGLDLEKVNELADGSSMLGKMALENGLIDKIGGMIDVLIYLDSEYEMNSEVCWY